ncbi:MAG TPA: hypothetical protein VMB03_26380 [Bryobacteraceae bacterium]|nr:hypothetical protein [Bryobacteraceae bacterium]
MRVSKAVVGPVIVAVMFAGLAFRLFRLVSEYAVNILFWDQWDFNDAALFSHHSVWGIFRFQHGPHRQGVGGILAALVEPWFRWNSRTEAFLVTAIVVLAGLCLLVLKYRLLGPLTWTDTAIPLLMFTPAQWESDWNTVNLAHGVLPVLLVVVYCIAWTWRKERAKYVSITAINFLTLYTGFGFFLGLITPALLAAKFRQARKAGQGNRGILLACFGLSILSLASFFISYKNQDASDCSSLFSAPGLDYLRFLCLMLASPFGIRSVDSAAILAGGLVLAAVTAVAVAGWKDMLAAAPRLSHEVLAIMTSFAILFCAAATVGRTCTGLIDAHASRYIIYKQIALVSLYFQALTVRTKAWRTALAALAVVLFLPSLVITGADRRLITDLYKLKTGWRTCYLSGKAAGECDEQNGAIYPDPDFTRLQQKLDYLRAARLNLFSDTPEVRR